MTEHIRALAKRPWRTWRWCSAIGYVIVALIAIVDLGVNPDHEFSGLGTFIAMLFWTTGVAGAAIVVTAVQRWVPAWNESVSWLILGLSAFMYACGLYMVSVGVGWL